MKLPVPPHLSGPEAKLLIDLVEWLVDLLIEFHQQLRRTYHPWGLNPDPDDWSDEIPF